MRFKGHKGNQEHLESARVRTRKEAGGSRSSFIADGDAVARMMELISCFPTFHDHAPLSSYRCGKAVTVVRYCRALGAIKEVVATASRYPGVLRVGAATTLVGGETYQNG